MIDALARSSDPMTSHEAAAKVDSKGLALMVLQYLANHPDQTSHEVADGLRLSLVTVSPRMAPLERGGYIERSGRRGGRTTWRAT